MSKNTPFLKLKNVSKFYYNKGMVSSGFTKVNLEFNLGEFVVITGESGSGKSTLLNVLSGLDTYEEGELYINGEETSHYGDTEFENYRKTYIGNIFQSFNLVNSYTVYQNIELVLLLNGYQPKDIKERIIDLIKKVDLYKYRNTKVSKLSGGQKQRVAIARALAKDTPIIIADEPTGNLDSRSASGIIKMLSEIAADKLVIIVTHNYEQVEKYATRKIEMHDGKVREDSILVNKPISNIKVNQYGNIDLKNKIKLGLRNTFNIFSKFALLFIVFFFVIAAFLGAYSSFKNVEYEESTVGSNHYFINTSFKRIVVNKKDLTSFSEDELDNIAKLDNVDKVFKKDYAFDQQVYYLDSKGSYYFGYIKNVSILDKVDLGRLPENDDEVVILVDYWDSLDESLLGDTLTIRNTGSVILGNKVKIVGLVKEDNYYLDSTIYVTNYKFNELSDSARINSAVDIRIDNVTYYLNPRISDTLTPGNVYISEKSDYCMKNECKNHLVKFKVIDEYYEDELELNILDSINNVNSQQLVNESYIEGYDTLIYFSKDDYQKLFDHGIYQLSVFVKDELKVDETAKLLESQGYHTLTMKETNYNAQAEVVAIIRIFKMVVLIGLFIVLFFISYFVIRLIEDSKKAYYAIVRILGGSKKVIKDLITIELLTMYHLTYLLFIVLILLNKYQILKIKFINENAIFLTISDYLLLYVILLFMSSLISYRYARKLFKSSAMRAYREEA